MPDIDVEAADFNPGGLPHEPKPTDFQYGPLGSARPPFEWPVGYDVETDLHTALPVDRQSPTSCGGWAVSKADAAAEAGLTGSFERRSAKDIYAVTAVKGATGEFLGSRMGDNAAFVYNHGVALEALRQSYENGQVASDEFMTRLDDLSPEAILSRKSGKAKSYAYVPVGIDAFAQAIRDNKGMVILLGGMNNGTWTRPFPKPPTWRQWGHFVYAGRAKEIDGKKYIGILNSWGTIVGDHGWQWLGEDYFASGFIETGLTFVLELPPVTSFRFTRDLEKGMSGLDVQMLQKYLNATQYPVAASGAGSPGQETTYFGELTRAALSRFQAAHSIFPTAGYLGPKTRAFINNS